MQTGKRLIDKCRNLDRFMIVLLMVGADVSPNVLHAALLNKTQSQVKFCGDCNGIRHESVNNSQDSHADGGDSLWLSTVQGLHLLGGYEFVPLIFVLVD
jgi:hypothetical protein